MRKKKWIKKLILSATLCLISVLGAVSLNVSATVNPDSNYYVTDKSSVLSSEVKQHIIQINHLFEKTEQKPQVAVVIIPTLDGVPIETYAVKQFEKMKIGNSDYDNGVLILLATEDREIRIEVGYGLEGALPDGKVGRILDQSMELLADGNYSLAIRDIFDQVIVAIQTEYGYEDVFNGSVSGIDVDVAEDDHTSFNTLTLTAVIGFVIYFTVCRFMGLSFAESLLLLMNFIGQTSSVSSSSRSGNSRSSGGGGRSGGGGASRRF